MFIKVLKMNPDRLFQKSAWKNVNPVAVGLLFLMLMVTVIMCIRSPELINIALFTIGLFLLLGYVLDTVCAVADSFILDKGRVKVYVFQRQEEYDIRIFEKDTEILIEATAYSAPFQASDAGCFAFRGGPEEHNKWFVWSTKNREPQPLGARVNDILFLPSGEDSGVRILAKDGSVETLYGDYIVYDSLYVPQGSQMCYADRGKDPALPDTVLLVRKDDKYQSYGFYLLEDNPCCREILISSIIFREGIERVLLRYDEEKGKYTEFFRCEDVAHKLNEYFIELTEDYRTGGKIYRYNGKTENLEKIYEGNFRLIDFEECIVRGDDGKDYGCDSRYAIF